MKRRQALGLAGGAAASVFVASGSRTSAAHFPPGETGEQASIIDGNLVAPIDPATKLDAATSAQIRSARLTAFKLTLGGSGNRTKAETDSDIADLAKAIAINPDLFMKVTTIDDLAAANRKRLTGIIYSFEAGEMLEGRIDNIDHFRSAGVVVMGLSYNRSTPFASGVLAPRSTGLTELGRQAVQRMNAVGVTVDVSHSDELSSSDAIAASSKPITITHAGCAAIHSHPRNKSDFLLRALALKGGVVGIYELSFLAPPPAQPTLNDYLSHLVHALNVCGEDHVGIGTDSTITPFDTSPESMKDWNATVERRKKSGIGAPGEGPPPFVIGLNRPDRYAIISAALRQRGYSSRIADKVLGQNFERVFKATWRTA